MTRTTHPVRRRVAVAALIGLVGVGGAGVAAAASPTAETGTAVSAQSTDENGTSPDRTDRLTDELAPLVEDGTITQDQADEVATTLAEIAH